MHHLPQGYCQRAYSSILNNSPSAHYSATVQAIKQQEEKIEIDFTLDNTHVSGGESWMTNSVHLNMAGSKQQYTSWQINRPQNRAGIMSFIAYIYHKKIGILDFILQIGCLSSRAQHMWCTILICNKGLLLFTLEQRYACACKSICIHIGHICYNLFIIISSLHNDTLQITNICFDRRLGPRFPSTIIVLLLVTF